MATCPDCKRKVGGMLGTLGGTSSPTEQQIQTAKKLNIDISNNICSECLNSRIKLKENEQKLQVEKFKNENNEKIAAAIETIFITPSPKPNELKDL